jgi:hypothetical protein
MILISILRHGYLHAMLTFILPYDVSHSTVASLVPADAIGVQNRLSSIRVALLQNYRAMVGTKQDKAMSGRK